MKKNYIFSIALSLLTGFAACSSEIEDGTTDIDSWPMPYEEVKGEYNFNHPCAMWSEADYTRVKTMLDNGTAPQAVKEEFDILKASRYAEKTYVASPTEYIIRGDGTGIGSENFANAMRDASAAYQQGMLWKLTGEEDYAKNAVKILNAWVAKCKGVTSKDANHVLAAGVQGFTFSCAADILLSYDGWKKEEADACKAWLKKVFAPVNLDFLNRHAGTCSEHYWSNWDLVNMCSYMAIGIVTEDDEMVNFVVNYFYNGVGNGYIGKLIRGTFSDPLGSGEMICQNQESGRDQGHAQMSAAVAANMAQMAYTLFVQNPEVPQLDFFAANDNALMKMGEYVALGNLKDGTDQKNVQGSWLVTPDQMPFNAWDYCIGCSCANQSHGFTMTAMANDGGRGSLRTGWEIFYNHYAKIKNLPSGYKYAKMAADKMRPEGGPDGTDRYGTNSGAFDQLGWGTLMLYRE